MEYRECEPLISRKAAEWNLILVTIMFRGNEQATAVGNYCLKCLRDTGVVSKDWLIEVSGGIGSKSGVTHIAGEIESVAIMYSEMLY